MRTPYCGAFCKKRKGCGIAWHGDETSLSAGRAKALPEALSRKEIDPAAAKRTWLSSLTERYSWMDNFLVCCWTGLCVGSPHCTEVHIQCLVSDVSLRRQAIALPTGRNVPGGPKGGGEPPRPVGGFNEPGKGERMENEDSLLQQQPFELAHVARVLDGRTCFGRRWAGWMEGVRGKEGNMRCGNEMMDSHKGRRELELGTCHSLASPASPARSSSALGTSRAVSLSRVFRTSAQVVFYISADQPTPVLEFRAIVLL